MIFSRAGMPGLWIAVSIAACGPQKAADATGTASEGSTDGSEGDATDAETGGGTSSTSTTATSESTTMGPEPTTSDLEPTTAGPEPTTGGPTGVGITGDFLLAVSTTVDRSKPFQFIARNVVSEMDGQVMLSTCLQPLSLAQGKVTTPREPVGDPLCFADIPLAGGTFTLDLGVVMIAGPTNPITGTNIVASLALSGTIQGTDAYCGMVSGMVVEPPVGQIDGSTFAAVRLTDPGVLPDPVVIDCKGTSVDDA